MGVNPDSIPRYEIPWQVYQEDEPLTGSCWNCCHAVEVKLGGKTYLLCVLARDSDAYGDVTECDPNTRNCPDWEE